MAREKVRFGAVMYFDLSTAVGFIISGPCGSNVIVIDLGANADFKPADVAAHRNLIESSDVILSPLEILLETALIAARMARAQGIWSILNPAPATNLTRTDLSCVSVLTPN